MFLHAFSTITCHGCTTEAVNRPVSRRRPQCPGRGPWERGIRSFLGRKAGKSPTNKRKGVGKSCSGGWTTPLKHTSSSVGILRNPRDGPIKNGNQTTNQCFFHGTCRSWWDKAWNVGTQAMVKAPVFLFRWPHCGGSWWDTPFSDRPIYQQGSVPLEVTWGRKSALIHPGWIDQSVFCQQLFGEFNWLYFTLPV